MKSTLTGKQKLRVLVTGSTGTIGANFVKRLVEEGYCVRAQIRPNSPRPKSIERLDGFDVERCPVDLCDREGVMALVEGMDYVVHLGMYNPTGDLAVDRFMVNEVNAGSTLALLEGIRTRNPKLKRFVYASSSVLYPQTGIRYKLTHTSERCRYPSNMYAVSKLTGEYYTNIYHREHQVPTVIIRVPGTYCGREVFGERGAPFVSPFIEDRLPLFDDPTLMHVMPPSAARDRCRNDLAAALADGKVWLIPLAPDGSPWRQHIGDVRDVCRALHLAMDADAAVGKACVVMSDALDYKTGIPHLSRLSGYEYAEITFPFGDYYWYDLEDTWRLLKYRPAYDTKTMFEDAWRQLHGEDIGIVKGSAYTGIPRTIGGRLLP